eukprot:TRINITY_DN50004_c0_g1_i1.p1 TRINITY_DN50004_c0_g1~~TRINITY_DN50004_c0_g1_i1.p1  ORF type:complete len:1146 (+),score=395.63 TRINITY_DN50004_c0_g1_i1:133-3570(+)
MNEPSTGPRVAAARWYDGDRIYGMCAIPGGRLFVGGSGGGDVKVYDPRNGKLEATLAAQKQDPGQKTAMPQQEDVIGHSDAVLAITYNNLGVFTAGADLTIIQWHLTCFEFVRVFTGHKALISALHCIPSDAGLGLFSGSDDRTIKQWNTTSGKCMHTFKGHKTAVNCILPTADARWLYSGAKSFVKIWSVSQRKIWKTFEAHSDAVWSIRLTSLNETDYLLTSSSDGTIKVWEDPIGRTEMVRLLRGHQGQVRDLLVWNTILFSCSKDGTVCVWDMSVWEPLELLTGHQKTVTAMTLQNNQLCTCSFDRHIIRWDMTDVLDRSGHRQPITQFQPFNPTKVAEERKAREEAQHGKYDEARFYTRAKKKQLARMRPMEAVLHYDALPITFIIDKLEFKCSSSELMIDSLVFIPFLIMFIFFFTIDRQTEQSYFLTRNTMDKFETTELEQQPWCTLKGPGGPWRNPRNGPRPECERGVGLLTVHKRYEDVATAGDYNDWVMDIVAPTLWPGMGHGYGQPGDPDGPPVRTPAMLGAKYLVGALRLRTLRVRNDTCSFNWAFFSQDAGPEIRRDYQPCYGAWTPGQEDRATYACMSTVMSCNNNPYPGGSFNRTRDVLGNYRGVTSRWASQWFDPGGFKYFTSGEIGGTGFQGAEIILGLWPPGGYTVEIPFSSSPNDAMDMLAATIDNGFIDDLATRMVVTEFITYAPYVNYFTSHKYFAEVAPGAQWIIEGKAFHFKVWTSNMVGKTVFDVFFLLFVIYYWRKFVLDWYLEFQSSRSVARFIFDPWNALELANMLCFLIVYGFKIRWWVNSSRYSASSKQPSDATTYPHELDYLLDDYQSQNVINAINIVLTFLKILKFFRLNSRLNILTRTLDLASQSILGVLVLFIWIVFAYSVTGNTLFGGGIFHFRSIGVSFSTLMRFLVGDFDYIAMRDENLNMAWAFFWTYQVLGMFILLNFIIAVLGDAFSDISKSSGQVDLDITLQKTVADAKRSCVPKSLKRQCNLWRHRKTQTGLLRHVVEDIKVKIRNPMLTDEQLEEQSAREVLRAVFVHRDDYMNAVSDDLKDDLSEEFLFRVWLDIAWEYHKDQCMGAVLDELKKKQCIEENIGSQVGVLNVEMRTVQDVRTRFDELEARVRPIVQSWQIKPK